MIKECDKNAAQIESAIDGLFENPVVIPHVGNCFLVVITHFTMLTCLNIAGTTGLHLDRNGKPGETVENATNKNKSAVDQKTK